MISEFYTKPFPVLDLDKKFYLREQRPEDTPAFFEYYTDPEVARYILASNPKTMMDAQMEIEYCRKLFQNRHGIYWTIARRKDDQMIGAIGLYINNNHHRGEICYDLSRNYWRRGIMKMAIDRVVAFSFERIGLLRVEAVTVAANTSSRAILLKCGFVHEGALKSYRYFQNKAHDIEMYGITPSMFAEYSKITR